MTRRPIPALYAALGVFAFLVVVDLAQLLTYLVPAGALREFSLSIMVQVGHELMIGLGVFLVLWLLTPISANSTISRTIGAGALAAVGAAVMVAVANFIRALVFARQVSGSLYDLVPLDLDPLQILSNALLTALSVAPLTVLAAVLVREWLRSKVALSPVEEPVATN